MDEDLDESDEIALITSGLVVTGNLDSNGSIDLLGTVKGNVSCKGKLTISGSVVGDSSAKEIFANNARIEGNIDAIGSIKVGQGTVIVGNVSGTSAVIAGAIKGDIDVHGPVVVDSTAVIVGDIKSKTVQINNGAAIDGRCSQCYAEINTEDLFGFAKKK
jgi:cytoskeletal protein CcmA (bactofilin family)